MKDLTDQFQLFSFWIGNPKWHWCRRDRNLQDRDLVKPSRPRLHHKFRNRDFKICGFCRNFSKKCRHHFPSWICFEFLTLFRSVFIVSYLQIQ